MSLAVPAPVVAPSHPPRPGRVGRLLAHFSRVTTSGRFIPEIDGLRFVAIALVFVVHVHHYTALARPGLYDPPPAVDARDEPDPLLRAVNHGDVGVLLFFVISGFVLALPFAEHRLRGGRPVRLAPYLLRRVTRLEPPYLAAMTLLLPLTVLFSSAGRGVGELAGSYLASCVYQHGLVYGGKSVINFVTWSLEIEVQFYLLVPLLARVFAIPGRLARRAVLAAAALGLYAAQRLAHFDDEPRLYLSVLNYGQYFLMGFLLADIYIVEWDERPPGRYAWDLVWLPAWPAVYAALDRPAVAGGVLPFLLLAVCAAALRGRVIRAVLGNRWVTTVGGMCYSIYLLHVPAISAFGRFTMRATTGDFVPDFLGQLALLTVPVLVVCAAFFALVERPCMKRDWPQRLWAWIRRR